MWVCNTMHLFACPESVQPQIIPHFIAYYNALHRTKPHFPGTFAATALLQQLKARFLTIQGLFASNPMPTPKVIYDITHPATCSGPPSPRTCSSCGRSTRFGKRNMSVTVSISSMLIWSHSGSLTARTLSVPVPTLPTSIDEEANAEPLHSPVKYESFAIRVVYLSPPKWVKPIYYILYSPSPNPSMAYMTPPTTPDMPCTLSMSPASSAPPMVTYPT
jgi:hypothetical protein